jgi:hypothetical protein
MDNSPISKTYWREQDETGYFDVNIGVDDDINVNAGLVAGHIDVTGGGHTVCRCGVYEFDDSDAG